jgi:hypothetical protein
MGTEELHKCLGMAADVKKKGLEWTGRLERMDPERIFTEILESKPKEGTMGRPR